MNPQLDTGIRRTIEEIRQQAREPLPWHDITARSTHSAADQPRDGRQRTWALLAVAALCVVVLVGGLIAAATNRDRELEPSASPQAVTTLGSVAEADWAPSVDRIATVTTPGNPFDLPVGFSSGIRVGMPVVNSTGLVGKIDSVTADRSVWMPLTDNRYAVGAKVNLTHPTESALPVAVEGQGSGQPLQLRFVDPAAASSFTVGDLVVTAGGSESLTPADIPIGRISARLIPDEMSPQTNLFEVTPNANLAAMDSVTVLLYVPASISETSETTISTPPPTVPVDLLDAPAGSFMNLVLLRGRSATDVEADVQAAIAACMSDKQFAYTPVNRVAGGEDVTLPLRDIQTRRESIGYGIVNRAFGQTVPDPNRAYWESLDADRQAEYFLTLSDLNDGCEPLASATTYAPLPFYQPEYQSITAEWAAELNANPRLAEAYAAWSQCMTGHGYDFANSAAARAFVEGQLTDLSKVTAPDDVELVELQATEVEIATADTQCFISQVQPIKIEVETDLLDQWVTDGRLPPELWPL
jgi:rod shape-determining protein MreC